MKALSIHHILITGLCTMLIPLSAFGQNYIGDSLEIANIIAVSKAFSQSYMDEDIETLSNFYTEDAKIMPPNAPIIEGRTDIFKRWTLSEGIDIIYHEAIPEEIRIIENVAHDYGMYKGSTKRADNEIVHWQGKYLIIWEKVGADWKIYLDIWNNLPSSE